MIFATKLKYKYLINIKLFYNTYILFFILLEAKWVA